ncbi:Sec-independent protein translocase protein TatB [Pseudoxanthomonas sp. F37]|uniref:Sec-independent protein translocase protein TatB n=1 Tax=Pseudoxanthomonas TaxID=83618 RepID=UPI001FD625A2|nr:MULTISPECIES: Sec-independent protein translocase protein TatB [Pseudoxanthomonas]UOV03963.1 Sec-independent protein translocase protein TatB [Pseudoxanthomonas mexicana]UOV08962.1 Sec-independent protein translocase protein TatB [Pseudoxanthomonas sp. F37]
MFDIGFSELLVIAVVALIVLGPERLPKAARFAGLWVRRARAQWYSVKDELERELASEELKRNLKDAQDALRDTEQRIRDSARETERQFEEVRQAARDDARALREDVESAITPPALAKPPAAAPDPAPAIEEEGRLASTTDVHDEARGEQAQASDVGTTADLFPPKEPR